MAHTPGPWKWRINRTTKRVYLVARGYTVLDFVRYGMRSAAPRFRDNENLMVRADEIAKNIPGYDHHSDWDQDLNHDDARLIAAAPSLYKELEHIVILLAPVLESGSLNVPGLATLNEAIAALEMARGKE
jgi:hypothetical protein